MKKRVDHLLVERGLAPSRQRAQALVLAGEVMAGSRLITKPGSLVPEDTTLVLKATPPFVSRGGFKLDFALNAFAVQVQDAVAIDVGASTGGFTDCLLQRGARRVYTVDVGYGQLDSRLRNDARVVVMDRTNARYLPPLPELADIAVFDVSFISLKLVVPPVVASLKPQAVLVPLIKPQFEVERGKVGKGGIVRDPELHRAVLQDFLHWAARQGWYCHGLVASPILGASGNREFLACLRRTPGTRDTAALVAKALASEG